MKLTIQIGDEIMCLDSENCNIAISLDDEDMKKYNTNFRYMYSGDIEQRTELIKTHIKNFK